MRVCRNNAILGPGNATSNVTQVWILYSTRRVRPPTLYRASGARIGELRRTRPASSVKCNFGLKLTQKRNTPAEPRRRPRTYPGSFAQLHQPAPRRRDAPYTHKVGRARVVTQPRPDPNTKPHLSVVSQSRIPTVLGTARTCVWTASVGSSGHAVTRASK